MDAPSRSPWVDPPGTPSRGDARGESGPLSNPRRRALAVGFGVVALSVLGLLGLIFAQFWKQVLWAGSLAVLFYPLHRVILRLVRGHASAAALLSTVVTMFLLFAPAAMIVLTLLGELRDVWPSIQAAARPESVSRVAEWLERTPFRHVFRIFLGDPASAGPLDDQLHLGLAWVQGWLTERLKTLTLALPALIYQGALTLLAFFFFLKHGPGWIHQLEATVPLDPEHARRLTRIAAQTINAVFRGVLLTAAAQATLAGLAYGVAGAPFPVLLGSVTFVAALIPFVGPVAVWLPTAIGLYVSGHPVSGICLGLWGLLVVSLIDNFLRPYLIGRDTRLPVFWLFLSILGGVRVMGVLGIVVGPAVLALGIACLRIYRESRRLPMAE